MSIDADVAALPATTHSKEKEGGVRGNLTQAGEGQGREGMGGAVLALGQVPCIPQTGRIQLHST